MYWLYQLNLHNSGSEPSTSPFKNEEFAALINLTGTSTLKKVQGKLFIDQGQQGDILIWYALILDTYYGVRPLIVCDQTLSVKNSLFNIHLHLR